ncbi:unnamed protein product [Nippostrongylus brasiliensis]|uniref:Collagen triple helix repeat protein n=1 Tax=Nippostrongylus brasiliensis TaxID=27835 RepID=A0A0N4YKW3_NIPBR|nr:unnamed protein product [Nippostrongylus brasiliensis]
MANSAWYEMRPKNVLHNERLIRQRRQWPPQCNCGPQSANCPAGPPGPPGDKGEPGEPGIAGKPGKRGNDGISISGLGGAGGCVKCPAGPPGEQAYCPCPARSTVLAIKKSAAVESYSVSHNKHSAKARRDLSKLHGMERH